MARPPRDSTACASPTQPPQVRSRMRNTWRTSCCRRGSPMRSLVRKSASAMAPCTCSFRTVDSNVPGAASARRTRQPRCAWSYGEECLRLHPPVWALLGKVQLPHVLKHAVALRRRIA